MRVRDIIKYDNKDNKLIIDPIVHLLVKLINYLTIQGLLDPDRELKWVPSNLKDEPNSNDKKGINLWLAQVLNIPWSSQNCGEHGHVCAHPELWDKYDYSYLSAFIYALKHPQYFVNGKCTFDIAHVLGDGMDKQAIQNAVNDATNCL